MHSSEKCQNKMRVEDLPPPPSQVYLPNKTYLRFLLTSKRTSAHRRPFQGKRFVLPQARAVWKASVAHGETYKQTSHAEERIARWTIQHTLWLEYTVFLAAKKIHRPITVIFFLQSTSFVHSETCTALSMSVILIHHTDVRAQTNPTTEIVITGI